MAVVKRNTIIEWLMVALIFYASLLLPLLVVQGTSGLVSHGIVSESPSSRTIVDDLGRSVSLTEIPQRIVSLVPSNTEILFALGLGDKVVGVTEFCNYPAEVLDKEKIGGFSTPDIEKIIALQPDLILAGSIHAKEIIPALEERGLTVFALAPQSLDGILEDIRMVGKITGEEDEASKLVAQMEARIEAITDKTQNLEKRPRVFYITWHEPLWSVGSGVTTQELIEKAGGANVFQDITGHKMVNLEEVIARDPEVIIACRGHGEAKDKPFEWAKEETRLRSTQAYKNNRIYQIDTDLVSRDGPRIVDALEWFAYFVHPDIFGKPTISDYPMEIVDQMGRAVTIPVKPARIISLSTANTEMLFALGGGSSIIGVDGCSKRDLKDTIPELEEISEVGEFATLDIEKIIALHPDLVLAAPYQKQAVERLEDLGLPVVILEARSIEAVLNDIKLIGGVADREETTSTLISNIGQRLKNTAEKTNNLAEAEKPTVLYLYEPLWVAGSNTMANDLIQKGGGVNVFSDVDGYKEIDLEAIIARDPQVIFCVQGYAPTLEYITGETRLEGVAAVRNGRVYGIQAALVDIPGPRIIDALDLMAGQLHPELFWGKAMDTVIDTLAVGKGDLLVCAGGGRWGAKGARVAKEAGARAVIIDLNQHCPGSKVADVILAEKDMRETKIEGISLVIGEVADVLANILRYEPVKWIIPTIPGGIAGKLTQKWLEIRELKIIKSKFLVRRALTGLPKKVVLSQGSGTITSSYMPKGMWCKIPCSQPKICPVTGRKKVAPMHKLLEFSLSETVDHYKIFVSQDLGGVGGVSGAEVKGWLEYVEGLEPPFSLAVAISCECHANTALFEIEEIVE